MRPTGRIRVSPIALIFAITLVVLGISNGHLLQAGNGLGQLGRFVISRFGPAASLALLYIEESGIPLPVPGDVYVAYLGHTADSWVRWVAAWVGVVVAVVAGASNLYLVSRRWGRRLARGRLGAALHLTPRRLATAEGWFARWGALAIIFGRHIPGCRIPITVGVGIFGVSYPKFLACVTVSTATWAAFWIWLGAHFGTRIGHFMGGHRWTYVLAVLVILTVVAAALIRVVRAGGPSAARES